VAVLREQKRTPIGERRAVPIGEVAGFTVVATIARDTAESSAQFSLAGFPGHTPMVSRDELRTGAPLGVVTRLENLARDLRPGPTSGPAGGRGPARRAKATARIGPPFEHAGRIATLRALLTVIDAELAPPNRQPAATTPRPSQRQRSRPGPAPLARRPATSTAVLAQLVPAHYANGRAGTGPVNRSSAGGPSNARRPASNDDPPRRDRCMTPP